MQSIKEIDGESVSIKYYGLIIPDDFDDFDDLSIHEYEYLKSQQMYEFITNLV